MYAHVKKRFKVTNEQLLELLKNPDYKEIFNDYESVCIQYKQSESDKSLHELNHTLIEELEEEITSLISKFNFDHT